MKPPQNRLLGQLAAAIRHHPDDVETVDALRRELKVSRAEDYVTELVSTEPAPTAGQRSRLAALLTGSAS